MGGQPLILGKVTGFRTRTAEITLRVPSGEPDRWTGLARVILESPGREEEKGREYEVEAARAYGDRLVLKLRGVDDPGAAADLRGRRVLVPGDLVPSLPEGVYFVERLLGLDVRDAAHGALGRVVDVLETGGVDVLEVRRPDGREVMVPMAREIVLRIDEKAKRIEVRLPEGLLEPEEIGPEGREAEHGSRET